MPVRRSLICSRACARQPFPVSRRAARRWANAATSRGRRSPISLATIDEWYAPNNATLVVAGDGRSCDGLRQSRSVISVRFLPKRCRRAGANPVAAHRRDGRSRVSVSVRNPRSRLRDSRRYAARRTGDQHARNADRKSALAVLSRRWSRATSRSRSKPTPTRSSKADCFTSSLFSTPAIRSGEAASVFQSTLDSALHNGFDPNSSSRRNA